MFQEDPIKYYATESECMAAAEGKARGMVGTFQEFGYTVESEAHSCQYVAGTQST